MAPRTHAGVGAARRVAVAASVLLAGVNGEEQVRRISMYRSLIKKHNDPETMQNTNLADIVGTLRYLQQEVVPEHSQSDPDRTGRKYDIDAIVKYDMVIKNPEGLRDSGVPGFGHSGAFDFGAMTTPIVWEEVVKNGDYVGASKEFSPQIKYFHHWYWYALTGSCPNLPWGCIKPFPECSADNRPTIPAHCTPDGCQGKSYGETCEKNPEFIDTSNMELVRSCCLHYEKDPEKVIQGGQCKADDGVEITVPTGTPGCVYLFKPLEAANYAMLDTLVGITSMKCGPGGKQSCKSWADWRTNCYDPEGKYKKRFQCKDNDCANDENPIVVTTNYCVEYDIHPFCQDKAPLLCNNPKCLALSPDERELGLPFWRGKCDETSNARRAEAVATALIGDAVQKKHLLTDPAMVAQNPTCEDEMLCKPNTNGGPYCTRTFAGLCSRCYIPGTSLPFNEMDAKTTPVCPYSVLSEPGMNMAPGTTCKSTDASDLCCLYGIAKCSTADKTTSDMELTINGFLTMASRQDNANMDTYLRRLIAAEKGTVQDEDAFADLVYWSWLAQPPASPADTPAIEQVAKFFQDFKGTLYGSPAVHFDKTSTKTVTTTQPVTVTDTTTTATTTSAEEPPSGAGTPIVLKYLGVGVVLVASFAGIIFLALQYCREQAQPQPAGRAAEGREVRPVQEVRVQEAELSRM